MYKIPLIARVVSLYLVIGLLVLTVLSNSRSASGLDNNDYLTSIVAEAVQPAQEVKPEMITGKPMRLVIPAVNIDLPITDGYHNEKTNEWTLSSTSVHYATMTSPINNISGHTLIYGHNNRKLLAPTKDLRPYDLLEVYTDNGKIFVYSYIGDEVVNPENTEVLSKSTEVPHLTLLTCEGLFYEKRRLMEFVFSEVR